jgi:putative DNA primase/helicase
VTLREIARALGGEVVGGQAIVPGPGHHPRDRSLSIRSSASASNGFLAFSFAGDDWRACRDYVGERLGLRDGSKRNRAPAPRPSSKAASDGGEASRLKLALDIFAEAVDAHETLVEEYLRAASLSFRPAPTSSGSIPAARSAASAFRAWSRYSATTSPTSRSGFSARGFRPAAGLAG